MLVRDDLDPVPAVIAVLVAWDLAGTLSTLPRRRRPREQQPHKNKKHTTPNTKQKKKPDKTPNKKNKKKKTIQKIKKK
ncbi:MAG: hypothetical protein ACRDTJ_00030, partial [Pseudonocardiaceae bacterium]